MSTLYRTQAGSEEAEEGAREGAPREEEATKPIKEGATQSFSTSGGV